VIETGIAPEAVIAGAKGAGAGIVRGLTGTGSGKGRDPGTGIGTEAESVAVKGAEVGKELEVAVNSVAAPAGVS
jgi:hypothetical protein